ncbi:leukocyte receptor cluster-like protein [Tasmannia lanceolata]|uniref:leukocyte receptor cluster-like protein n=1 Tax=Tasmannia lanceolata TaxID=3420 RepID=UPI004064567A
MGGHGGLNILPQKRWNVYRNDNREKVRRDEEAAAKEEQLKREQSRKRDAEFRLERLRTTRGVVPPPIIPNPNPSLEFSETKHINLFQGLSNFPNFGESENPRKDEPNKKQRKEERESIKAVVLPEDEKFRLGYGVAGKGVKAPWYLSRPSDGADADVAERDLNGSGSCRPEKKLGKKTLDELREERVKRERREKERERALMFGKNKSRGGTAEKLLGFSRK